MPFKHYSFHLVLHIYVLSDEQESCTRLGLARRFHTEPYLLEAAAGCLQCASTLDIIPTKKTHFKLIPLDFSAVMS